MEHKEVWRKNENVGCSCGYVFSSKGFPIHAGMMNKRNRRAIIEPIIERLVDRWGIH